MTDEGQRTGSGAVVTPRRAIAAILAVFMLAGSFGLGRLSSGAREPEGGPVDDGDVSVVGAVMALLATTARAVPLPYKHDLQELALSSDALERAESVVWGGDGRDSVAYVAVAPDGVVYAAGDSGMGGCFLAMCSSELVQLAKVTLVMRQVSGLAIGPDGSVYVAGGLGRDSIVVRYGPGLEELESVTRSMGQVRSIDVAPDGTVYVAGHSYDAPFSGDRYHADIVRYAPDLTTLSTASLHWPGNSSFASVAASIGEFLHVCALAHVEDSGGGRQQVLFIYQCTMLEVLRSSSINSDRVAFQFIAFAPDDTIFVIGYTHREDRSRVAVITNFNARAFEIGFSMVGVDGVDYSFNDLSIAPDGSVYVVGCSEAGGYSSVVRYSSGLEVLGIGLLDGETYNAVVIAPDGSAYVGGSFVGREAGNGCEAIVVRYVP